MLLNENNNYVLNSLNRQFVGKSLTCNYALCPIETTAQR